MRRSRFLALFILLSPLCAGEKARSLTYWQNIDGKKLVYQISLDGGETGSMITTNHGCMGIQFEQLKHDVPNEVKIKINHMWDIKATFDGDKIPESIKAMVGKTYIFQYKNGVVLSIEEVGTPLVENPDE